LLLVAVVDAWYLRGVITPSIERDLPPVVAQSVSEGVW
jgi:hypothetical protein